MVPHSSSALRDIRAQIVGLDIDVPLLDGSSCRPVNFDNAASTGSQTNATIEKSSLGSTYRMC